MRPLCLGNASGQLMGPDGARPPVKATDFLIAQYRLLGLTEPEHKVGDTLLNLVPDRADLVNRVACGVGDVPVFVVASGQERTDVGAVHGDDYIGGEYELGGPAPGDLGTDADPSFCHDSDRRGPDASHGAVSPGGPGNGAAADKVGKPS